MKLGRSSGTRCQHWHMTPYTGAGQLEGESSRPPSITSCITSVLPRPGYGSWPSVITSHSSTPNDLPRETAASSPPCYRDPGTAAGPASSPPTAELRTTCRERQRRHHLRVTAARVRQLAQRHHLPQQHSERPAERDSSVITVFKSIGITQDRSDR